MSNTRNAEISDEGWEVPSDEQSESDSDMESPNCLNVPASIPRCSGFSREEWAKKEVVLVDVHGSIIANAVVEFVGKQSHPNGTSALGNDYVGVVICETFGCDLGFDAHSIQRWSVHHALLEGVTLFQQEQAFVAKTSLGRADRQGRRGCRKYVSCRTRRGRQSMPKKERILHHDNLREALRRPCCNRHCMRQFSTGDLAILREEMYHGDYKAGECLKLAVHRGFHYSSRGGQRLSVVEGRIVCLKAWQIIYAVSKTNFYEHAKAAREGKRAQNHGNTGKNRKSAQMLQAQASMEMLLNGRADPMPHRPHTTQSGQKVVQRILPTGTKWKGILEEVNVLQEKCGVKKISQSSCSKIRKKYFSDFQVKRRGDGFARCGKCDRLTKRRDMHPPGSAAYRRCHRKYVRHLIEQEAARAYYYRSRSISCHRPLKVLSIMHDKMDHSKTSSPCLAGRTKKCEGFAKLPVSVAGILAHGHGDEKYAHYTLDLYPADSNQTIGSIARLLRDLEMPPKSSNPSSLFAGAGRTDLYRAILRGREECVSSLPLKPSTQEAFCPLPPILHVQLDNCWKDNKSRYIMCFWSLLVAKCVFVEIHVSFMLVGHTHDDIDASFGRWSMKLHENDYPTVPLLMKSYMDLEDNPVIPTLIEEVPDFKAFIADCISEDDLMGHSQGRQFLFYRRDDGWPLMKYKMHCTDEKWLPENGIQLWQALPDGKPKLPSGIPDAVMPHVMKGHDEVVKGITGFIEHWKAISRSHAAGCQGQKYDNLVEYWTGVIDAMAEKEMECVGKLVFGFWPRTRQSLECESMYEDDFNLREEGGNDDHYIGPRSLRPAPTFRAKRDCTVGNFLLARPADDSPAPIWCGEAMSDPVLIAGDSNFKNIKVKWYRPKYRRECEDRPYWQWDTSSTFKWEIDDNYDVQWLATDSILTAWKSRRRNAIAPISIPKNHVIIALDKIAKSFESPSVALSDDSDSEEE